MVRIGIARVCAALVVLAGFARAQGTLYTVTFQDDQVREVDPVSGLTLSQQSIVLTGQTITQGLALAVDPTTNVMYAVLSIQIQPARRLVTLDPTTGQATLVGLLPDRFSGIAFDNAGQMYGVSGDGAANPESLWKLDKTNATGTLVTPLGNGSVGETIGFQPFDGLIYHASGVGLLNDAVNGIVLETVDPVTAAVTNVPLSGATPSGIACLIRIDASTFLVFDQSGLIFTVTTAGVVTQQSAVLDHFPKAGAYLPGPSFFESYGAGCAGSNAIVPQLTGSPSPNPGSVATIQITQGFGGAPGLMLFGTGTGSAQLVPTCSAQVFPLLPVLVPLALTGSGAGAGSLTIVAQIPPAAFPGDVNFQVVLADRGAPDGVSATAPLHLHLQ